MVVTCVCVDTCATVCLQLYAPESFGSHTRVVLVGALNTSLAAARTRWPHTQRLCERTAAFHHPLRCDTTWAPPLFARHNPSTGLVALAYLRSLYPDATFTLVGWTFHADQRQTFTTHNFAEEERLVRSWPNVHVLDPGAPTNTSEL
jgi:hypothetical protein